MRPALRFAFTASLLLASLGSTPALASQGTTGTSASASATPRPNPDAFGKYHIGDGVSPPTVVHRAFPKYSAEARDVKLSGYAVVAVTITTSGLPVDVHLIRSVAEDADPRDRAAAISLDEKAIESAKHYRFEPAMFRGQPVPVDVQLKINFEVH